MKVGDLVTANTGAKHLTLQKHHGKVGIVIDAEPRWPNSHRENEMLLEVLFPDGQQGKWSERHLEVINESR